jgi:hypothetical protein
LDGARPFTAQEFEVDPDNPDITSDAEPDVPTYCAPGPYPEEF